MKKREKIIKIECLIGKSLNEFLQYLNNNGIRYDISPICNRMSTKVMIYVWKQNVSMMESKINSYEDAVLVQTRRYYI